MDQTTDNSGEVEAPKRIFISYGRKDAIQLAENLAKDLSARGYQVWLDKEQIETGHSWEEQIETAILDSDLFISLLSPHAVRRPDGVCLDEISMARYNNRRIIPLMVINCRPPLGIYRLDWLDMQDWTNPVSYEKGIDRLLGLVSSGENSVEGIYSNIFGILKPIDFKLDIYKHVKDFVGREWILNKIQSWVEQPTGKVMFLTGDPGSGKTALMAKLIHILPQVGAYYFCMAKYESSLIPDRFIHTIASQLATQLPDYREALSHLNLESLSSQESGSLIRQLIVEPLNGIDRDEPLVIIIDALDEALVYGGNNIASLLYEWMDEFPAWFKIIVTSRRVSEIMGLFDFYKPGEIFLDSSENLEDIRQFVTGMLSAGNESASASVSAFSQGEIGRVLEDIINKSEGIFLYAKTIVTNLLSNTLAPDQISALPPGLSGIYQTRFKRIFKAEQSFDAVKPLLEIILASFEPLSPAELAKLRGLPPMEIKRQLKTVEEFFPEKEGLISAFHKSMSDWLLCSSGTIHDFACDAFLGHAEIAGHLLGQWKPGSATHPDYLVQYLPKHLIYAGQSGEAQQLLSSFAYIEQRCSQKQVYRLIEDFSLLTTGLLTAGIVTRGNDPDEAAVMWDKEWHDYEASSFSETITAEKKIAIIQAFLFRQAEWIQLYGDVKGFLEQQVFNGGLRSLVFEEDENADLRSKGFVYGGCSRKAYDPFPPVIKTIYGHKQGINDLSINSEGDRLVSASFDRSVKLWNLANGECIKSIKFDSVVEATVMASDNRFIGMAGQFDGCAIWFYNHDMEELLFKLGGHTSIVRMMRLSGNNERLVSCSDDHTFRVWDLNHKKVLFEQACDSALACCSISDDGSIVAIATGNCLVEVWNVDFETRVFKMEFDKGEIRTILLSPDGGEVIIGGGADKKTEVWDIRKEALKYVVEGHGNTTYDLFINADQSLLATSGKDRFLKIWDFSTGSLVKSFEAHTRVTRRIVGTHDLSTLVTGGGWGSDKLIRLWDIYRSRNVDIERGAAHPVGAIYPAYSGGEEVLLCVNRKQVYTIQRASGERRMLKEKLAIRASMLGHGVLYLALQDGSVIGYQHQEDRWSNLFTHSTALTAMLPLEGDGILLGDSKGAVLRFEHGELYPIESEFSLKVKYILESQNFLVVLAYDDRFLFLDKKTGGTTQTYRHHQRITSNVVAVDDHLYFGDATGSLVSYEIAGVQKSMPETQSENIPEALPKTLPGVHKAEITSIGWHAASKRLITACAQGQIKAWRSDLSGPLFEIPGHPGGVSFLKVEDGPYFLSVPVDTEAIKRWHIFSARCEGVYPLNEIVTSISADSAGGLFVGQRDGRVHQFQMSL